MQMTDSTAHFHTTEYHQRLTIHWLQFAADGWSFYSGCFHNEPPECDPFKIFEHIFSKKQFE